MPVRNAELFFEPLFPRLAWRVWKPRIDVNPLKTYTLEGNRMPTSEARLAAGGSNLVAGYTSERTTVEKNAIIMS